MTAKGQNEVLFYGEFLNFVWRKGRVQVSSGYSPQKSNLACLRREIQLREVVTCGTRAKRRMISDERKGKWRRENAGRARSFPCASWSPEQNCRWSKPTTSTTLHKLHTPRISLKQNTLKTEHFNGA